MVDAVLAQYKLLLFHGQVPMAFPPATRVSDSTDSAISTAHIQNGIVRIRNEVRHGIWLMERRSPITCVLSSYTCSGSSVPCIRSHASAGHLVVYFVMAQMVGNRRSPGATILGGESEYPLPPTIALRSRRQLAYILIPCGRCMTWLVLYLQTGSTSRRPWC